MTGAGLRAATGAPMPPMATPWVRTRAPTSRWITHLASATGAGRALATARMWACSSAPRTGQAKDKDAPDLSGPPLLSPIRDGAGFECAMAYPSGHASECGHLQPDRQKYCAGGCTWLEPHDADCRCLYPAGPQCACPWFRTSDFVAESAWFDKRLRPWFDSKTTGVCHVCFRERRQCPECFWQSR